MLSSADQAHTLVHAFFLLQRLYSCHISSHREWVNPRASKGHSRKRKGNQGKYGSCRGAEGGKKREQEYELDQQNRALDAAACDDVKKTLKSCKKRNRLSQL